MTDGLPEFDSVVLWFGLLWFSGWVFASLLYRRLHGKPLFATRPQNARFVERWVSGSGDATWLARLGGASNCLRVALTPTHLEVLPHFPFTLVFLPEMFDLEHRIALDRIVKVEPQHWFKRLSTAVHWRDQAGRNRVLRLAIGDAEGFTRALDRGPVRPRPAR